MKQQRGMERFNKISEQFMVGITPLRAIGGPIGGNVPPSMPMAKEPSWMPKLFELIGYAEGHLPMQLRASAARMDDFGAHTFRSLLQALAEQRGNLEALIATLTLLDRLVRDGDATIEGGEVRQLLTLSKDVAEFLRTITEGAANS